MAPRVPHVEKIRKTKFCCPLSPNRAESSLLCEFEHKNTYRVPAACPHLTFVVYACGVVSREGLCGWGNFEKQTYTRDNHEIVDGVLMITVSDLTPY